MMDYLFDAAKWVVLAMVVAVVAVVVCEVLLYLLEKE
jgi:hypothetical protein